MVYCLVLVPSRPFLAPNRPSHPSSNSNFSELSPFFAATSETSQEFTKSDPVTSFFSIKLFRSFALFFTLEEISPVVATLTKKYRGVGGWHFFRCEFSF